MNFSPSARALRRGIETLEERTCLSVTISTVTVQGLQELRIVGDGSANTVAIVDDGSGHVEVSDGDGNLLGSGDDIDRIRYLGKDGTDTVTYTLTGALTHDESLYFQLGTGGDNSATLDLSPGVAGANLNVAVYGAAGADTISTTLGSVSAGRVNLLVDGRAGDDTISVLGSALDVAADGLLNLTLEGGRGADTITTTFDTLLAGRLGFAANGGAGTDTISANLTLDSGSTGRFAAQVTGGADVDDVTLNVNDETAAESADGTTSLEAVHAAVFDPSGEDTLAYTDNVSELERWGCFAGGGFRPGGLGRRPGGFGGFGFRGFRG